MGRHSLPDAHAQDDHRARPKAGRRTLAISTALVLSVAAGTAYAAHNGLFFFGGSCDESVRLSVVASPDVAPALTAIADRARDDRVTTDGRCLEVKVSARESYEVADALADEPESPSDAPDFQVWVPDSRAWVERAKGVGDGVPVATGDSIATSPVTLAALRPAATDLGWPSKTYTWNGLTKAVTRTEQLRLGTADPTRSATGLLALDGIAASSREQGADGDTTAAATAKLLSQRMSGGDAEVLETLTSGDSGADKSNPRRNQTVFLSEQAAFRHNATADRDHRIDLFYPKDGAALLDYPYAFVNEAELSVDQGRAAQRFLALLEEGPSRAVLTRAGFRVPDRPVARALVRAAGGAAPQPYGAAPTEPPAPEAVQQTLGMWTITVQSARLTTVVDTSGSMAEPVPGRGQSRMEVTKGALIQAIDEFTPEDEIGLWEFATALDGVRDYRRLVPTRRLGEPVEGGGTHRSRLTKAFSELAPVPEGATGLYDTTLAAYQEAQASYVRGKFNALVVLTDGANQDQYSISRSSLVSRLRAIRDLKRPVPLIVIAIGPNTDQAEIEQIAEAAGGSGHQVDDPTEIQPVILKAIIAAGRADQP
ncbi:substrate-binding domain-containing protein [Streptomyces sp. NPDC050504]|uniref:substrate-binding domain-containing protein n=1 Tax=Streptomyces sp. NPDC050504 TaxID=3365618 RepID=UPI0037AD7537